LLFIINTFAQDYLSQTEEDAFRLSQTGLLYDARTMSMGNAASIISNTYTATLFNPATLGLAEKFTVNSAINLNLFSNNSTYINNQISDSKTETNFTQFGLVYPVSKDSGDHNLVFSLGYNQSNDFNKILKVKAFNSGNSSLIQDLTSYNSPITRELGLSYPVNDPDSGVFLGDKTIINGNLMQNGSVLEEGGINFWSAGAAYEFAGNVFFGVSANYAIGSYRSNREFTESDTENFYPDSVRTVPGNPLTAGFESFYLNDVVDWDYNGWDVRFGALYKFFNFIAIGGAVKLPTKYHIIEKHFINGESDFASGWKSKLNQEMVQLDYSVESPYEFTAGAMVNLWIITAAAEATYIDYTQMKFTEGLNLPKIASLNKNIIEKYSQALNIKGGAEFRLPFTGISARAGFIYNMSPLANAPQEYDKKYLTAGLGISSGEGSLEFNLAYMYGWWDEPGSEFGNGIPTINQSIEVDNILASFTLRF